MSRRVKSSKRLWSYAAISVASICTRERSGAIGSTGRIAESWYGPRMPFRSFSDWDQHQSHSATRSWREPCWVSLVFGKAVSQKLKSTCKTRLHVGALTIATN